MGWKGVRGEEEEEKEEEEESLFRRRQRGRRNLTRKVRVGKKREYPSEF